MSGFTRRPAKPGEHGFARGADRARFADFYKELDAADGPPAAVGASAGVAVCTGPVKYTGQAELQRDIDNFKAALSKAGAKQGFLPVAAPASVIPDRVNEHYKSEEDLLVAIAEAMRTEYRAIVDAGLYVQLDDARLAVTYDRMVPPKSFGEYKSWVARQVELINHALEGIPEDRVRYHVCWGSWPGPHTTDVPLKSIVDEILKVKAGLYLIEGANPRHEHEWQVWKEIDFPENKILGSGVITHATNIVEHPELVAERVARLAKILGPRARHGEHRLRLRAGAVPPPRAPDGDVGKARVARRRRQARASLGLGGGDGLVHEAQLLDRRRRHDERVGVGLAQAAVQVVEHVGKRMPVGDQPVEGLPAFAFRHGDLLQAGLVGTRRAQAESGGGGDLERVGAVEIVRPGSAQSSQGCEAA